MEKERVRMRQVNEAAESPPKWVLTHLEAVLRIRAYVKSILIEIFRRHPSRLDGAFPPTPLCLSPSLSLSLSTGLSLSVHTCLSPSTCVFLDYPSPFFLICLYICLSSVRPFCYYVFLPFRCNPSVIFVTGPLCCLAYTSCNFLMTVFKLEIFLLWCDWFQIMVPSICLCAALPVSACGLLTCKTGNLVWLGHLLCSYWL